MNDDERRDDRSGPEDRESDSFFDPPGERAPDPAEVPVVGTQPGAGVDGGVRKPADYYSQDSTPSEGPLRTPEGYTPPPAPGSPAAKKAGCPTWLVGCGAAVVIGALIIIGLIWWGFSTGKVFTMVFSSVETVLEESVDIDEETREALKAEIEELNRHIADKELEPADLQGPMTSVQAMLADQEIDQQEAEDLLEMLETLNDRASSEEF